MKRVLMILGAFFIAQTAAQLLQTDRSWSVCIGWITAAVFYICYPMPNEGH